MNVKRTGIMLKPNHARVVFRPFEPHNRDRIIKIIARVMTLSETEAEGLLEEVMREFHGRHQKIHQFFLLRFDQVKQYLLTDQKVSHNRQLLIGSYFTLEYALESAALFNPCIVWHPDQAGLPPGSKRFILSLRATGEGHISSITFRSGTIDAGNQIRVSPHTIRHTTATHLLRAGVDINTIRAWLGHVSLATTNVYAEVDLEMKAKALAKCEVEEEGQAQKPWREDKGLMEFLRTL
jgi:integrase-like protein